TNPCSTTIGATTMISERPNKPRGNTRFARCESRYRMSAHPVRHEYVTHAADRLDIERELRIFLDLSPEAGHLHVDRALQRHAQSRAEIGARERPPGVAGKKFEQRGFRTSQANRAPLAAQFATLGIEHRIAHLDFPVG